MDNQANDKPVLVIPCSGIGKVHGLISRESTYLVADELAPGITETLCLGLLVKRRCRCRCGYQKSVLHHN